MAKILRDSQRKAIAAIIGEHIDDKTLRPVKRYYKERSVTDYVIGYEEIAYFVLYGLDYLKGIRQTSRVRPSDYDKLSDELKDIINEVFLMGTISDRYIDEAQVKDMYLYETKEILHLCLESIQFPYIGYAEWETPEYFGWGTEGFIIDEDEQDDIDGYMQKAKCVSKFIRNHMHDAEVSQEVCHSHVQSSQPCHTITTHVITGDVRNTSSEIPKSNEQEITDTELVPIDWACYQTNDKNGNPTIIDATELWMDWLLEECEVREYSLANTERCFKYYAFRFTKQSLEKWMRVNQYDKHEIALAGLALMFNENWIKSPAFVEWRDLIDIDNIDNIRKFLLIIDNISQRIRILEHFIDNIDYLYGKKKDKVLPGLNYLKCTHKEAKKVVEEEYCKSDNSGSAILKVAQNHLKKSFYEDLASIIYSRYPDSPQPTDEPAVETIDTEDKPRRRGPRTKHIFLNKDGEKDEQRTLQEAQLVKKYLSAHHLGNKKLDSSKDTKINKVVANFWLYWNDRNFIDKEFSGTALYRFLTDDCGLECNVVKNAFSGTIQELIDLGPDSEIFASIAEFYENINKNK